MDNQQQEIKIELTPEVAKGIYSNLAVITHGANEFFIDFITMAPNMPGAKVQSRIIMSPENAKNLLGALMENVKKYESPVNNGGNNGEIPNPFIMGGKA